MPGARCPPFRPRAPPPLLGVSSWFPAPQPQRPRSGPVSQSLLITAWAWPSGSYLCLGPQSTWPPGLCPAGSQAAGAPASVAGSCSPPAPPPPAQLGLGFQGLVWGGWWGRCLSISPTADLCTFLVPAGCGGPEGQVRRPTQTLTNFPSFWGACFLLCKTSVSLTSRVFQSAPQRPVALSWGGGVRWAALGLAPPPPPELACLYLLLSFLRQIFEPVLGP